MSYDKNLASLVAKSFLEKKHSREELIKNRKDELYSKIPSLKELDDEIASISFSVFLSVADGYDAEKASKEIKKKADALTKKRDNLIKEAGFPKNYLNPSYDCPICKDEGFLENGYCTCFKKKLMEASLDESNLATLSKNTFDTFSFDCYSSEKEDEKTLSPRENMVKIYESCKSFAENFNYTKDSLFLTGPSGLGKTFLSSCIANHLIKEGVGVVYQSAGAVFSLLDRIKFFKNSSEDDLYTASKIFDAELLILDDLGTEFITDFSTSELFRLINTRLLCGRKTVISTNLSLSDIKKTYSERIFSRIAGNFVILNFYGKDIRFQKKLINKTI